MLKNSNLIVMLTDFYTSGVTMVSTHFKHSKMIMFSHCYLKNELILDRLLYCFDFFSSLLIFL